MRTFVAIGTMAALMFSQQANATGWAPTVYVEIGTGWSLNNSYDGFGTRVLTYYTDPEKKTKVTRIAEGQLDLDYKDGFTVNGAIGARLNNGLSVAIEADYLAGEIDIPDNDSPNLNLLTGMVAARYHLPIGGLIDPYLGAGVGFATGDNDEIGSFTAGAVKAIVGVNFPIREKSSLFLEYNHVRTGEIEFTHRLIHDNPDPTIHDLQSETDYSAKLNAHNVKVGFRYAF